MEDSKQRHVKKIASEAGFTWQHGDIDSWKNGVMWQVVNIEYEVAFDRLIEEFDFVLPVEDEYLLQEDIVPAVYAMVEHEAAKGGERTDLERILPLLRRTMEADIRASLEELSKNPPSTRVKVREEQSLSWWEAIRGFFHRKRPDSA